MTRQMHLIIDCTAGGLPAYDLHRNRSDALKCAARRFHDAGCRTEQTTSLHALLHRYKRGGITLNDHQDLDRYIEVISLAPR